MITVDLEPIPYTEPDSAWHRWANMCIRRRLERINAPQLDWDEFEPVVDAVDWDNVTVEGVRRG